MSFTSALEIYRLACETTLLTSATPICPLLEVQVWCMWIDCPLSCQCSFLRICSVHAASVADIDNVAVTTRDVYNPFLLFFVELDSWGGLGKGLTGPETCLY